MKKIIIIIKWSIIILVMGAIFYLSSQSGTASRVFSDQVMQKLKAYVENTTWLTPTIRGNFLSNPVIWTRKLAHLIIYLILGLVSYWVLPKAWPQRKRIVLVLIFCLIYAITDEIHQLFVPGRSAQVLDVLIDTIGSSIGLGIGYLIKR